MANVIVDCMKTDVADRYAIKVVDSHTRKKNRDKGEVEGKRKAKGDEVVREMYD